MENVPYDRLDKSSSSPSSCLVRPLWLVPLLVPLALCGGGVFVVLSFNRTAISLGDGDRPTWETQPPPSDCVDCEPSLVGCALVDSFTTTDAVEKSLADQLGIFPARVRVTKTSGCPDAVVLKLADSAPNYLYLEVFDQIGTEGDKWKTGRELCTELSLIHI